MQRALTIIRAIARTFPGASPPTACSASARRESFCSARSDTTVRFCIVGCGPAGFYCADKLLKRFGDRAQVDLLDRLPTPFGLVRSGVAPDHQQTKNVQNQFTDIGADPRVCFFGNVQLGKDVSLSQLRSLYHSVVLAYGAESDRKLGVPGEVGSRNVVSAREFVWWYNSHPDGRDVPVDLSHVESVAVCGVGNVALDCARVLLQPVDRLASTDVGAHAVEALKRANKGAGIKQVHLIARRGVAQAACTPKELKELSNEFGITVHALPDQLALSENDQAELKKTRMKRRVVDIITQAASKPAASAVDDRHLHFQFNRNPVELVTDPSSKAVTGVKVEKTRAQVDSRGNTVAVGTGEYETIPAQLVLVSIGYKSVAVEGLPSFDTRRGVVPNVRGRVTGLPSEGSSAQQRAAGEQCTAVGGAQRSAEGGGSTAQGGAQHSTGGGGSIAQQPGGVVPGLYVVGWLKRGPSGIIGTNLIDAEETVECIVADHEAAQGGDSTDGERDTDSSSEKLQFRPLLPGVCSGGSVGREGLQALLTKKSVPFVTFDEWLRLNRFELEAGEKVEKVREKVASIGAMLEVCHDK